jgi:hypothetical protein
LIRAAKLFAGVETFDAHSAKSDTLVTELTYNGMLKSFNLEDKTIDEIVEEVGFPKGNVDLLGKIKYTTELGYHLTFGKYKNHPLNKVVKEDIGYINWVLNTDMPRDTKNMLELLKMKFLNENS